MPFIKPFPSLQTSHSSIDFPPGKPPVDGLSLGHGIHAFAPFGLYVLAGHKSHLPSLNPWPFRHDLQALIDVWPLPLVDGRSDGHDIQVLVPLGLKVFLGHFMHVPFVYPEPSSQLLQLEIES